MHKRVLLAEASDNIRTVAETLLRQNGFEVLAVASGPKASEVCRQARPDLIIVGGELTDEAGQPLFATLQGAQALQGVPVLVFNDPKDTSLPLPDEIIVPRPFDPRDFIEKVMVFSGRSDTPDKKPANPLEEADMDDEFLDAALGLDQVDATDPDINVTESEVMNGQTTQIPTNSFKKKPTKEFVGMEDHAAPDDADQSGGHEVESIMINEDKSNKQEPEPPKDSEVERIGTSKIDIADLGSSEADEAADHDYNWFINSMQEEVGELDKEQSTSEPAPPDNQQPTEDIKPEDLKTGASEYIDPVTPPPGDKKKKDKSAGVEKFIDEFKKEIEKFEGDELERVSIDSADTPKEAKADKSDTPHKWEDTIENVTTEDLNLFTRQFAQELANKLSDKLADRLVRSLDTEKLLIYLRNEILARAAKK
jgi:hypothetical protein